jgi:hypothetical protein
MLIGVKSSTSAQSVTAAQHKRVMPTTQITATILSFARRVSRHLFVLDEAQSLTESTVCVSSILIAEIKKIIKESEIMK